MIVGRPAFLNRLLLRRDQSEVQLESQLNFGLVTVLIYYLGAFGYDDMIARRRVLLLILMLLLLCVLFFLLVVIYLCIFLLFEYYQNFKIWLARIISCVFGKNLFDLSNYCIGLLPNYNTSNSPRGLQITITTSQHNQNEVQQFQCFLFLFVVFVDEKCVFEETTTSKLVI